MIAAAIRRRRSPCCRHPSSLLGMLDSSRDCLVTAFQRQCNFQQRTMSSGKKSNKKQAMQRQRRQATPGDSSPASSSKKVPASSGFFNSTTSRPVQLSSSPILSPEGLSRLDLRPDWNRYSLTEKLHDRSALDLSWEPNKPGGIRSGLLLRNKDMRHRNLDDNELFEVDREAMFDPSIHLPHAPQDWKGYEPATPLSDFLMQRIGVSGQPITTAEYMRHALTHPLYGYYTKQKSAAVEDEDWDNDDFEEETFDASTTSTTTGSSIFGRGGDFVTAPELSSVFGHSLCVWFMTVWQQAPLYKPSAIQIVELGPGRGTLMADLLELAHSSKLLDFGQSIKSLHLVEASKELREEQKQTLQKALGHLIKLEFADGNGNKENGANESDDANKEYVNTIQVYWHDDFSNFHRNRDKGMPTMIILQEFLDALPVHQFQKTDEGWRERMIDVVSVEDADGTENAQNPLLTRDDGKKQLIPRLRQVLAPNVTPAVELLLQPNQQQYDHFPEGTVVEICPDALVLMQDIAVVLEESHGAALIVDYGEEGTADTLRAFSKHQQVPLTSRPGQVDVTADVDFFALKNCLSGKFLRGSEADDDKNVTAKELEIHAFGPVPQGEFLMKMGAANMTVNAIEKEETTEDQAQAMADALKYLVMPEHMGEKFKVLALARKRDGLFGPAGMEK